eukprot:m.2909 g.2909  ORF g.2909 m.2909 type:complete len:230 (+) comp2615_c0_seq2:240-929(+)
MTVSKLYFKIKYNSTLLGVGYGEYGGYKYCYCGQVNEQGTEDGYGMRVYFCRPGHVAPMEAGEWENGAPHGYLVHVKEARKTFYEFENGLTQEEQSFAFGHVLHEYVLKSALHIFAKALVLSCRQWSPTTHDCYVLSKDKDLVFTVLLCAERRWRMKHDPDVPRKKRRKLRSTISQDANRMVLPPELWEKILKMVWFPGGWEGYENDSTLNGQATVHKIADLSNRLYNG